MSDEKVSGLAGWVFLLALPAMGYVVWHGNHAASAYPEGSVCYQREIQREHVALTVIDSGSRRPDDTSPQGMENVQAENGKRLAEAMREGAEQFFSVLDTAEKAKATGVARPATLCLPEKPVFQREALYAAYSADLESRIKAHAETCTRNADADAMAWIVARFPCPTTPATPRR